MLTNEEALRLIKECDECFVVWATDQNAIVAGRLRKSDRGKKDETAKGGDKGLHN